jgi:hypothetical protein
MLDAVPFFICPGWPTLYNTCNCFILHHITMVPGCCHDKSIQCKNKGHKSPIPSTLCGLHLISVETFISEFYSGATERPCTLLKEIVACNRLPVFSSLIIILSRSPWAECCCSPQVTVACRWVIQVTLWLTSAPLQFLCHTQQTGFLPKMSLSWYPAIPPQLNRELAVSCRVSTYLDFLYDSRQSQICAW